VDQLDDNYDEQTGTPASMESDMFSSVTAPAPSADLKFEDQYFMDAEQPPEVNAKRGSSWMALRIWGDTSGDVKKTS
jgi:hypothetical protein